MKVKILRDTVADGRDVYVGEVHDISSSDAKLLARMGKALIVEEMEGPAPVVLTTMSGPEAQALEDMTKTELPAKAAEMNLEGVKPNMNKPEAKALEGMTKAELLAKAAEMNLEGVKPNMNKPEILEAIKAAQDDFKE